MAMRRTDNGIGSRLGLGLALKSAMLALVLLAAEAFAAVHPLELDAHANDEPCKICISIAAIGAAAVAKSVICSLDAAAAPPCAVAPRVAGRSPLVTRFARGPPASS